jgi:hypothetical protein
MAKRRFFTVLLLVGFASGAVFAQTSSQVNAWIDSMASKASQAYRLARQDPKQNADRIIQLLEDCGSLSISIQNAANKKILPDDAHVQKFQNALADVYSTTQLAAQFLR